jgi:hypothetical protein
MIQLMIAGGPLMWPLLVLGVVGLATAAWFAWRAEARVRGFLDSMSRSIACVTVATLAMDVMATLYYAARAEPAQKGMFIMQGVGESMSPLVMGFGLLTLIHLLTAIGQRRLDGKTG